MKRCICFLLAAFLLIGILPMVYAAELTDPTESLAEDTLLPTDEFSEDATQPTAESVSLPEAPTEETGDLDFSVDTPAEESTPSTLPSAPSEETTLPTVVQEPAQDEDVVLDIEMDEMMFMSIDSTQSGIMLFNYMDNGDYTTRLNYQVSCTYQLNGTGGVQTAYIKNLGWHFARYGGVPYPDNPLYCLEPYRDFGASTSGNTVDRGVTLDGTGTTAGSNVWYALPAARREAIGQILLYSSQMWNRSVSVSTTAYANNPNVPLRIATQFLIYEIVCGLRDPDSFVRNATNECGTSGDVFYNAGVASVPGFTDSYGTLEANIQSAKRIPSFTGMYSGSAPVITLTGKETGIFDSNGVLPGFNFSNGNGASFEKIGDTLYITQTGDISESGIFQASRGVPSAAGSTYDIWYMNGSSYQTTISLASASSGNLTAYFRLKGIPQTGGIRLTKTTEDGQNLSDWQFGIYADSACTSCVSGPHTTDTSGTISVFNLNVGTYYVKELGHTDSSINALYSCASTNPQRVTVPSGGTAAVSFYNKLQTGAVKLVKATNTGNNVDGWKIGLYSDAGCTSQVSGSPFTTGTDGTVTVTGLKPGTYYAKEVGSADSYWVCDTEIKMVLVEANKTASVTFTNTHYGRIQFRKCTNTGNQLGGWVFLVRNADGDAVGEYTTDETGYACTENLLPGRYTVQEKPTDDLYWTFELWPHDVTVEPGKDTVDEWLNKEQGLGWFYKKTNTGENVEGWHITVYSDEGCTQEVCSMTTNQEGKAGYYLDPGIYWAKETGDEHGRFENEYWMVDETVQVFEIKPHENTEITFTNVQCGKLRIVKAVDTDGSAEGWLFKITDATGTEIEGSPFATDQDGIILTENLLPGFYTIEELLPEDSLYCCKSENPQAVTVTQGQTTESSFVNGLRTGKVTVSKMDITGSPLEGAAFLLEWSEDGRTWYPVTFADSKDLVKGGCSNPDLVDGSLTTGTDGILEWSNLYPGLQYRLTETKAPEGFNLLKKPAFEGELPADDLAVAVRVINTRLFTMPDTGTSSALILRIASLAAALGCLCLLIVHHRKKKV